MPAEDKEANPQSETRKTGKASTETAHVETEQGEKNVNQNPNLAAKETEKTADTIDEASTTLKSDEPPEPTVSEIDPLEKLVEENKELQDKVLRLAAEMENLRRRTEREKQDMAKFAITNFARDILTIDDNLNRALNSVPKADAEKDPALNSLYEGIEMTGRELLNVFERYGITRIDPRGEIFDPNSHQAMFEMPNPEVPAGTIVEVVATGFMIESRVLRPAMVGIAKGGEKPIKSEAGSSEETQDLESNQNTSETDGIDKTA